MSGLQFLNFRSRLRSLRNGLKNVLISDRQYVINRHKKLRGRVPDVDAPKTLNEKILWLKLNDRTPLHTRCADKSAVRGYVAEKIGEDYLIPIYFETEHAEDIIPQNLPDLPVIIKTNHDSGGAYIVRDKEQVEWNELRAVLKRRISRNYYYHGREWQYKHITPKILVEHLLVDETGSIPFDYKLHVFNGKVRMIQVDMGRGTDRHYRNWYSRDWNREPYKWSSPKGPGKFTDPSAEDIPKPESLDEMIELSERLAEPFDYVRVDWYDHLGKVYFGEITFHHDGGNQPILPAEYDLKLGNELQLTGLA